MADFDDQLYSETGSFSKGDYVEEIIGMHVLANEEGEKNFYCTVTW